MSDRLRHGRAASVGIVLAALFAACSGSTPSTQAPGVPSLPAATSVAGSSAAAPSDAPVAGSSDDAGAACAIVTKEAVSQAIGFTITLVAGADTICTFQTVDSAHYVALTLYHSQADMASMLQIETGSDHIAGLGDDAFFAGGGSILFVRQGNNAISILDADLTGSAIGSPPRDAMVTLIRSALPKL